MFCTRKFFALVPLIPTGSRLFNTSTRINDFFTDDRNNRTMTFFKFLCTSNDHIKVLSGLYKSVNEVLDNVLKGHLNLNDKIFLLFFLKNRRKHADTPS
jgi:hypothetical protein